MDSEKNNVETEKALQMGKTKKKRRKYMGF